MRTSGESLRTTTSNWRWTACESEEKDNVPTLSLRYTSGVTSPSYDIAIRMACCGCNKAHFLSRPSTDGLDTRRHPRSIPMKNYPINTIHEIRFQGESSEMRKITTRPVVVLHWSRRIPSGCASTTILAG